MSTIKGKQPENWQTPEDSVSPTTQLESFRREWIDELETSKIRPGEKRSEVKGFSIPVSAQCGEKASALDAALDTYIQGCKQERDGRFFQATMLYRKAIKMDANVEHRYRLYLQSHPVDQSSYNTKRNRTESKDVLVEVDALAQKLEDTSLTKVPVSDWLSNSSEAITWGEDSMLNQLPMELVERLVSWIVYLDIASVSLLAATCKQMALLLQRPSIWKFLSDKAHNTNPAPDLSLEIRTLFANDWFSLYLNRPRIRQDGVFISKVEYLRTGYSDTFLQPIHVVTYYRYLRFFPGNVCLVLTTLLEPAQVVRELEWNASHLKGIMRGTWQWEDYDQLCVECIDEARSASTMFQYRFTLSQTKRGRQNRLNWITCSSYDLRKPKDDPYIFPSTQLRNFHFSRVKSIRPFH